MEASNFNKDLVEIWWVLLKRLSVEANLELASRLIDSLKQPEIPEEKTGWKELYGAWADEEQSAEELIELIRNSRYKPSIIEPRH
jgi:hypothetical protein